MKLDLQKYLEEFPQCNPFESDVWGRGRIRRERVQQCIRDGDVEGKPCPLGKADRWSRPNHERRVAWLVLNGWTDAVEVDVGCPNLPGGSVDHPTWDGNHRIAAALFRGDLYIEASCSGDVEFYEQFRWSA